MERLLLLSFSSARKRFALRRARENPGSSWIWATAPADLRENVGQLRILVPTFERDDVIQIRGRVKLYNGRKELTSNRSFRSRIAITISAIFSPHAIGRRKTIHRFANRRRRMKNPWLRNCFPPWWRILRSPRGSSEPRRHDHASRFSRRPARTRGQPDGPRRGRPGALSRTRP